MTYKERHLMRDVSLLLMSNKKLYESFVMEKTLTNELYFKVL